MGQYYGLIVFICCWTAGFGTIPAPTNVSMESFNFKNTLRWNWPADLGGDVIFIVQYKIASASKIDYKTICVTQEQQCESSFIAYESNVRVQAQLNLSTSDWATIYFDPYSETIIGAPNAKVSSRSGFLDVSFDGPSVGTDEGSLKEKYGELLYRVVYWKESDPAHVLVVNTSQNTDILQDLEPRTMYCVKVQAYVSEYKKAGDFSPVICKETTDRFGTIPAPTNVSMESFNFKNTLRWNWPADLGGDVIFIVQYKIASASKIDYKTICVTQEQQCESSVITYESNVRVQAQLNLSTSDWATIYFDPYSETIIGAPNAKVSSRSGFLDVSFDGPSVGTDEGSLKEKYGELLYRVVYWKESDPAHVLVVNTSQNTDILQDLEPWTMYCVKVQAYVSEYKKAGDFSPVICKETTDRKTSSWKIVVVFLGSMALIAVFTLLLTFISFKVYKMTQYLFYPSYTLPQHLKEYLSKPFYNAPYLPPQPTEECGESCEQLTFISEEAEEKDAA